MTKAFSHQRAIVYALLAFIFWTGMDCFTKLVGQDKLPVSQIIVISSFFCFTVISVVATIRGRARALVPQRWKIELGRSVMMTVMAFAGVIAFTRMPFTTVYTMLFTGPMIVAVLSVIILRESLSGRQSLAVLAGFGGVIFALRPDQAGFSSDDVLGWIALILLPVLGASNIVFVRFLRHTETNESLAFIPQFVRVILVLPLCLWQFQPLTFLQLGYLAAIGFMSAIGLLLMMQALRHAPAPLVWSFQYSQLVTGGVVGYLIWDELPSHDLILGSAVIIASGLYLTHLARRNAMIQRVPARTV